MIYILVVRQLPPVCKSSEESLLFLQFFSLLLIYILETNLKLFCNQNLDVFPSENPSAVGIISLFCVTDEHVRMFMHQDVEGSVSAVARPCVRRGTVGCGRARNRHKWPCTWTLFAFSQESGYRRMLLCFPS